MRMMADGLSWWVGLGRVATKIVNFINKFLGNDYKRYM